MNLNTINNKEKNKLVIISNESISKKNNSFFCDNIDLKSTPEGLSDFFDVNLIGRSSKKNRSHHIKLKNIDITFNFFSYILKIFKFFSKSKIKYLIVSITPYTFFAIIFLKLFKKKPIVYLRSDGFSEYKVILGIWGPFIYGMMFNIVSRITNLISCRKYILHGRSGDIVSPSQLNKNWFINTKTPKLDKVRLLYVGRIKKEKGIFSLIKLLKEIRSKCNLTIIGADQNFKNLILEKNINLFCIESDEKKLIEHYDNHNIFILPSYTEGHPMVILESLARLRPVIIFKDIEHVIEDKKGIFVAERNSKSLLEKIDFIKKNYFSIQEEMKKNNLPTNQDFLRELSSTISKIN